MKELKILKKSKLTESEKKELFSRVKKSVETLSGGDVKDLNYPIPSPFYRFTFMSHSTYMKAGVLALLILSLSGATAYASLGSLPGDMLYGVKVNVVEKVSKIAARSPESRARQESTQIERRVDEFEKLAEKGELTEAKTQVIEKHIEERLKDFDRNVTTIKERKGKNIEKIREEEDLEERLEKHAERILKIREEDESSGEEALESVIRRTKFGKEGGRGEQKNAPMFEIRLND
ncbi:MAG: DUF5667 domain-containing protein [Candidatus Paceibacterota bacterium]|jgi:hypothetical protein